MKFPQGQQQNNQSMEERAMKEFSITREFARDRLEAVNYNWDRFLEIMTNSPPNRPNEPLPAGVVSIDEDLQRAIELSNLTHMEEQKRNQQPQIELGKSVDEDVMMQRAMLISLQPGYDDIIDPRTHKREGGTPVGLKNIGNTCYINSLLQTYFMLPTLRNLVFAVPTEETPADDVKTRNVKKFMRELQLLFGKMILTNVKWVDPSNVIDAIVDDNHRPILSIGKQEDLGEFMNLFVDWMEKGLKLIDPNEDKMKEMFEIKAKDLLTAEEENGELVQSDNDSVHTFLMLDVKHKDFNHALDEAFVGTVYWTTPKNHATQAVKQTWFTSIPPVVMLQETRVKFDRESQRSTKNRTPMEFQQDIDLARFLLSNKDITTKKREEVGKYRQEMEEYEKKIGLIMGYPNAFGNILNILNDTNDTEANIDAPIDKSVITQIIQRKEYYESKVKKLSNQVSINRNQIDKAYEEISGKPYTLYALWIHSGPTPGSGHYWTYIRNFSDNTWIKCNDTYVNLVNREEVWRHAIGGEDSDISAYFLIYVSEDMAKSASQPIDEKSVPPLVYEQVQKENEQFLESIVRFIQSKETDVDKFVRSYIETMERVNNAKVFTMTDPRITSFGFFLKTVGIKQDELIGLVLIFLWSKAFPSDAYLESAISSDSASYRAAKRKLFPPSSDVPEADADDKAKALFDKAFYVIGMKDKIFADYQTFRIIYYNILEAFKELTLKNYAVSLKYLYHAYEHITKLSNVPDLPDVLAMIRVVITVLISNFTKLDKDWINQLNTAIYVIHLVFKKEWNEQWMEVVREQVIEKVVAPDTSDIDPTETIISWTDISETPQVVSMGTGLLGHDVKEEDWETISQEYMVEYNKFTSDFKDIIQRTNGNINLYVPPVQTPDVATETVSVGINP